MNLLRIEDLHVSIRTNNGIVKALAGINLEVNEGDALCLIGESGCGKTTLALSIMRLLPEYAEVVGNIWFKGKNILLSDRKEMRSIRGKEISMIFEQPATCLNPVLTAGEQIADIIRAHKKCSRKLAKQTAIELLNKLNIKPAPKRYQQYPHQFSGGMQQRTLIAMALANNPSLLIADEPTTSLDASVQVQIVELLRSMIAEAGSSLLLITHDLVTAIGLCDSAAVMYAGEIVEQGKTKELLQRPRHPYTKALINGLSGNEFDLIEGQVPELSNLPEGCHFHPRCPLVMPECLTIKPLLKDGVRCHHV